MKSIRTPDARFENLLDYNFEPHYVDVDGLRMHYVDEGPRDGQIVLLLHGEPSWSFLYRYMIPPLVAAGFRAIAPDLIGFGRSDKPTSKNDYSYAAHVDWTRSFIEQLDLTDITLFCQDWGSLIGLRIAAENEHRFARIALSNGGLPTGDQAMPKAFMRWQQFARYSPVFPIGKIISKAVVIELSDEAIAGYDAPFPSNRYKAGTRAFPLLVPTTPDNPASDANRAAWEVFKRWDKPFMTMFGDKDPITRGGDKVWQQLVPGARAIEHITVENGGHFIQEEKGPELAAAVIGLINSTS